MSVVTTLAPFALAIIIGLWMGQFSDLIAYIVALVASALFGIFLWRSGAAPAALIDATTAIFVAKIAIFFALSAISSGRISSGHSL